MKRNVELPTEFVSSRTLLWLLGGLAVGLVFASLRDVDRGDWTGPRDWEEDERGGVDVYDKEPVLGYDGMDQETILEWIDEAELDEETLERIIEYEESNRRREPVLEALHDLLG
jgi:hypothetical protein